MFIRKMLPKRLRHRNIVATPAYDAGGPAMVELLESRQLLSGVIGMSAAHVLSSASIVAPLTVTSTAPVAVNPGSGTSPGPVLSTTTPSFQWNPVTGVAGLTGYQINLENLTLKKGYSYRVGSSVTSYTVPPSVLVPGDQYVWNVRILANGQSGSPSNYLYFQIPSAVTLPAPIAVSPGSSTAPGPVLTASTPTLRWDGVIGVSNLSGYQINLYDQTASKGTSYTVGASQTSFTVPAGVLVNGHKYVWNVRALAGSQSGPPSAYLYFQAPAPVVLSAPTPLGPGSTVSPGLIITTSTPTFKWTAVTGVDGLSGYQINLYNQTAHKSVSYTVGASNTTFTLPADVLVPGDSYVWNVRILVGSQSGPPSAYVYFQTQSTPSTPSSKITAQIQADTRELSRLGVKQRATQRNMASTDITSTAYNTLLQNLTAIEKQERVVRRELKVLESET